MVGGARERRCLRGGNGGAERRLRLRMPLQTPHGVQQWLDNPDFSHPSVPTFFFFTVPFPHPLPCIHFENPSSRLTPYKKVRHNEGQKGAYRTCMCSGFPVKPESSQYSVMGEIKAVT